MASGKPSFSEVLKKPSGPPQPGKRQPPFQRPGSSLKAGKQQETVGSEHRSTGKGVAVVTQNNKARPSTMQRNKSVLFRMLSTFHLREAPDTTPIGDVERPRVADFAYSSSLYCDLSSFGDRWEEAAAHLVDTIPGDRGNVLDRQRAVLLSVEDEGMLQQLLSDGVAYQNQQVPISRQFRAGKELLQVHIDGISTGTPVQITRALIAALTPFGRVVDVSLGVLGKSKRLTQRAVVTLNTAAVEGDGEARPEYIDVGEDCVLLSWHDRDVVCRYCHRSGHHVRACPLLRRKTKREDAQNKRTKDGPAVIGNTEESKVPEVAFTFSCPATGRPKPRPRTGSDRSADKAVETTPADINIPKRKRRRQRSRSPSPATATRATAAATTADADDMMADSERANPVAQSTTVPSAPTATEEMAVDDGFDAVPVRAIPCDTVTVLSHDADSNDPNGLRLRQVKVMRDGQPQHIVSLPTAGSALPSPASDEVAQGVGPGGAAAESGGTIARAADERPPRGTDTGSTDEPQQQ
jgi:hypothetical protein